jgi:hypothetical protein
MIYLWSCIARISLFDRAELEKKKKIGGKHNSLDLLVVHVRPWDPVRLEMVIVKKIRSSR